MSQIILQTPSWKMPLLVNPRLSAFPKSTPSHGPIFPSTMNPSILNGPTFPSTMGTSAFHGPNSLPGTTDFHGPTPMFTPESFIHDGPNISPVPPEVISSEPIPLPTSVTPISNTFPPPVFPTTMDPPTPPPFPESAPIEAMGQTEDFSSSYSRSQSNCKGSNTISADA